jgi:hypothetical protein
MRAVMPDDRGSTIPLVLGFFLIGLLVAAGAVMASDAFTKQRDLQSVCDGAAIAATNAVADVSVRTGQLGDTLPLAEVQSAADAYLAGDPSRSAVTAIARLSPGGRRVIAECAVKSHIAFGSLIGRGDGIEQRAISSAEGRLK